MATKKKRNAKSAGPKSTPAKKRQQKKATPKRTAQKASSPVKTQKKATSLKRTIGKKKPAAARKRKSLRKTPSPSAAAFSRDTASPRSGEQAGDLEGLSHVEDVDSESVDELAEEGNAFEAGVIAGVEDAGDHEEQEVRTREVPEDDVPGEYLDEE